MVRTPYIHSIIVRLLRWVVPLIVLALLGGIVLWPNFKLSTLYPKIKHVMHKTNLVINPRISSIDDQGKPYQIQAKSAQQLGDLQATLDNPKGNFVMEDGTELAVSASIGDLKKHKEELGLSGSVDLKSNSGYELKAPSATVDLKTKTAESSEAVYGKGPQGEIHSDQGVKITSDGQITFKGKTKLLINPESKGTE